MMICKPRMRVSSRLSINVSERHCYVWLLLVTCLAGCGGGDSPYPEVEPVSVFSQAGVCESCGKAIPKVVDTNVLTIKGNQYVVCGETCSTKLEDDIKHDRHGGHEH